MSDLLCSARVECGLSRSLCKPWFPYLVNENGNSICFIMLLRGLNENSYKIFKQYNARLSTYCSFMDALLSTNGVISTLDLKDVIYFHTK